MKRFHGLISKETALDPFSDPKNYLQQKHRKIDEMSFKVIDIYSDANSVLSQKDMTGEFGTGSIHCIDSDDDVMTVNSNQSSEFSDKEEDQPEIIANPYEPPVYGYDSIQDEIETMPSAPDIIFSDENWQVKEVEPKQVEEQKIAPPEI